MRRQLSLFLAVIVAASAVFAAPARAEPGTSRPHRIESDLAKLPAPVARMRDRILEAARSGDLEAMRPVLESSELMPVFSFGGASDPLAHWKEISDDGEGREILAVMVNILSMPYVRLRPGASDEMYAWPYLHEADLEKLTPEEEVDLYRLVTPGEARVMREYGAYIWYRLGIGPDGTWHYFVAGD